MIFFELPSMARGLKDKYNLFINNYSFIGKLTSRLRQFRALSKYQTRKPVFIDSSTVCLIRLRLLSKTAEQISVCFILILCF